MVKMGKIRKVETANSEEVRPKTKDDNFCLVQYRITEEITHFKFVLEVEGPSGPYF